MSRTRHYRDLIAWQKAMDLARMVYTQTEGFPKSETFGLCMQMRRSSVNVATAISAAHGRLNDSEMRRGLGTARAAINELQTQAELAGSLAFLSVGATGEILELATRVAKLINGLLGVLDETEGQQETGQPANSPRAQRAN